jgi:integrase
LVNETIVGIRDEVGVASARTCKSIIYGTMAIAVRHGALTLNPVRDIEILSKARREPLDRSEEERDAWFELMSQDQRAARADMIDISKFMLATSERIGETLAVRWENVSLETGDVDCNHQLQRIKGKGLMRFPAKTQAGDRLLLLPKWAVTMLRARSKPGTPLDSPVFPPRLPVVGIATRTTCATVCEMFVNLSATRGEVSWVGCSELIDERLDSPRQTS